MVPNNILLIAQVVRHLIEYKAAGRLSTGVNKFRGRFLFSTAIDSSS